MRVLKVMTKEKGWKKVLCAEDIPLIRGLLAAKMPVKEIAKKFLVSNNTIYRIALGETWSHIKGVAK
tara:strand:- start:4 stop:204 length:201 start_codon:yes stop_codon:yes gene_type:complete